MISQYHEVSYKGKIIPEIEVFSNKDPKKYRGTIYCPECQKSQVYIVKVGKTKKLVESKKSNHEEWCSANVSMATLKQRRLIFNELEAFKVRPVLIALHANRFEQEKVRLNAVFSIEYEKKDKKIKNDVAIDVVDVEHITADDSAKEKIFFGTARPQIKYIKDEVHIALYAPKSDYLYITLKMSKTLFEHFPKSVVASFNRIKPITFMYFGKLNIDKRKYKTTRLRNTDCFIVK